MHRNRSIVLVALAAGMSLVTQVCYAQDAACSGVNRANVVRCALAASLASKAERQGVQAVESRRLAARTILPSNPVLSFSAGRRVSAGSGPASFDWDASLAQELEIGGQRGARLDAAHAELVAQQQSSIATDRDVALQALVAYFEVLAAGEELRLARLLEAMALRVSQAATAAAAKGLASGVDADVAEAAMLRMAQQRIVAEQAVKQSRARLSTLLGRDLRTRLQVEGALEPLANATELAATLDAGKPTQERPEVIALEAQSRAFEARAEAWRRTRIPNPTLSLFAQNDVLDEKVFGVGIAIPIPMPGGLGHTYAGEIQEADALALRAATQADGLRRELRGDVRAALDAFLSLTEQRALYTPERTVRAAQGLQAIATEIEAGRLAIRDAIVTQQALVEVLRAELEARTRLCLASLELARAAGVALERGAL